MENFGLKGLLVTLYQRVILSYKTTLVGLAIYAASVGVEYLTHAPNKTVSTVAAVIGSILLLVKERYPAPPPEIVK